MILWPFIPSQVEPIRESLEWLTDILKSRTGAEQRRALRITPRRTLTGTLMLSGTDRVLFDLLLQKHGSDTFALPIWPDGQFLAAAVAGGDTFIPCATSAYDFVNGGYAALFRGCSTTCELVQVETVEANGLTLAEELQNDWPAGASIYPVRAAMFAEFPDCTRKLFDLTRAEVRFQITEACEWDYPFSFETYRFRSVLDTCMHAANEPSQSYERITLRLDNEVGPVVVTDTAGRGFALRQWNFIAHDRVERARLRARLYAWRGRQKTAWIPSRGNDLKFINGTTTTITVEKTGYTDYGLNVPGRQDIRITLADGTAYNRRVTDAEVIGSTEVLTLAAALPSPPSNVRRIEFLTLCRMNDDSVEFEYQQGRDGLMTVKTIWRAIRDDLEYTE